ncbi:hypothetical protein Pcinc_043938 [Petrolisthes cinctipes]|uniref:Uncharacterized protein n=1 Tax=Petrolisthes cinctipes TaxID=88211 RepID=A0AAE1EEU6_PETCI|nr:hypothetical protein Pcinc_043938 [Petrolisthes cinctipes]
MEGGVKPRINNGLVKRAAGTVRRPGCSGIIQSQSGHYHNVHKWFQRLSSLPTVVRIPPDKSSAPGHPALHLPRPTKRPETASLCDLAKQAGSMKREAQGRYNKGIQVS